MKSLVLLLSFSITAVFSVSDVSAQSNGVVKSFAGTGVPGFSGDGGPATLAMLDSLGAIAIDRHGAIYVSTRGRIRKIDASGIITTVAGVGTLGFSDDGGPATAAELSYAEALAVDTAGNIYFGDRYNRRVRKINTSGIISTIAGTGASGFSGDGGPAIAAKVGDRIRGMAIDAAGNVYISQTNENRVRKIDVGGIITTVVGDGTTAVLGDGGPATLAAIQSPLGLAFDTAGNLYIADNAHQRIRRVNTSGIISTFAGNGIPGLYGEGRLATNANLNSPQALFIDGACNVFVLENSRIRKVDVKDGRITTLVGNSPTTNAFGGFGTNAYLGGQFFVMDSAHSIYIPVYWQGQVKKIQQCASFNFYIDKNANCILDSGDVSQLLPVTVAVDSNGIAIDTISATSHFSYSTNAVIGTIYNFKLVNLPASFVLSCGSSGIISDTITSITENYFEKNIALECGGAPMDLVVTATTPVNMQNAFACWMWVYNNSCTPSPATLSITHSPKYVYSYSKSFPAPLSIVGNTVTWTIPSVDNQAIKHFAYKVLTTAILTPGDTVQSHYAVTPTAGDSNPANNALIYVDTVKAGFDPNFVEVVPAGCIMPGTELEYTIHFENTGNDTAFNIYVIDSLSDYLEPQSFRVLFASHQMNTTRIYSGGHSIMKFDFQNINLPDSSHHGLCDGMFRYKIRTKSSLPIGTRIYARAGIYFDINPVVVTNTTENIADCSKLDIATAAIESRAQLYPNPATNELIIRADGTTYTSFTITNTVGQEVMSETIDGLARVNIKTLPGGMYYVTLAGVQGREVLKFVKQ